MAAFVRHGWCAAMWQGILGHDQVVARFRRTLAARRLASSYLFVGPPGIGKRTLAVQLAQGLLCPGSGPDGLDPCQTCSSCQLFQAGTHPDFEWIVKPVDRGSLPIEAFIGDREHRHREGLCHTLALKPQQSGRRVAVIDDADALTHEAANCLLKTLEEPPPRALLILIGTSTGKQLPTILSRCQVIRFVPLGHAQVAEILLQRQLADDPAQAQRLAVASGGSLTRAAQLADPARWQLRQGIFDRLAKGVWDHMELTALVADFVSQAGRESVARRQRVRDVVEWVLSFYGEQMRTAAGAPRTDDPDLRAAVRHAMAAAPASAGRTALLVERCLAALAHVDRHLNQTTLLECWLDDLRRIAAGTAVDLEFSALG